MNESITRAAGGVHGQELDASKLQALARHIGRTARQRTTLYGAPDEEHVNAKLLHSWEAPSSSALATVGCLE
jgi:FO synthase